MDSSACCSWVSKKRFHSWMTAYEFGFWYGAVWLPPRRKICKRLSRRLVMLLYKAIYKSGKQLLVLENKYYFKKSICWISARWRVFPSTEWSWFGMEDVSTYVAASNSRRETVRYHYILELKQQKTMYKYGTAATRAGNMFSWTCYESCELWVVHAPYVFERNETASLSRPLERVLGTYAVRSAPFTPPSRSRAYVCPFAMLAGWGAAGGWRVHTYRTMVLSLSS